MSIYGTNPTLLSGHLALVKSGDTILLAPGDYGAVTITGHYDPPLTIRGSAQGGPATFSGLTVAHSSGIVATNLDIGPPPGTNTTTATSALMITGSSNISVAHCKISFGSIYGRCATIQNSSGVTLSDNDMSQAFHGVVVSQSPKATISGGSIHDIRTSPIVGSICDDLSILNVGLKNSNPIGSDHADFIHIWIDKSQTQPTKNLLIHGVTIEQGTGVNILGINTEDQFGVGFENVRIENCNIHLSNTQGIIVEHWLSGAVLNNVLKPCKGADPIHNIPRVILRADMASLLSTLRVEGNTMTAAAKTALSAFPNNTWLTKADIAALIA